MNIKSFLKKETGRSCEWLVVGIAEKLKSASFDAAAAMFIASASVFRGLGMDEELRLLGLLFVSRFGEKAQPIPAQVNELIFGLSQDVPVPATESKPQPVAPIKATTTATPSPATKPATATAPAIKPVQTGPARTLETSNDQLLGTWRGQLRSVAGGNTDKTLLVGVTNLTTRIFSEPIAVSAQDWPLLFSAAKAVNKNGTSVINNKIATQAFFGKAPTALVREYVFAEGGVLGSVMANMTDLRGKMEQWLQGKADVLLNAVCALGKRAGLSESEIKRLEQLHGVANGKAAPKWLVEKIWIAITTGKPAATAPAQVKQVEKVNGLQNLGELIGSDNTTPKTAQAPAETPVAKTVVHKLSNSQKKKLARQEAEAAKAVATASINAEPESVATAVVAKPKQQQSAKDRKPEVEDLDSDFAQVMLAEEGGTQIPPAPEHEESDIKAMVGKPIFTMSLGTAEPVADGQKVNGKLVEPPRSETPNPDANTATVQ